MFTTLPSGNTTFVIAVGGWWIAAAGDRGVSVGHLQRRHRDRAQGLGRVVRERRRDPHRVRRGAHLRQGQVLRELREHGVVGVRRRPGDADRALVAELGGVHGVRRIAGQPSRGEQLGRVVRPVRVAVVVVDQRHQREHLERRPGLPVALPGVVERRLPGPGAVLRGGRHRDDVAVGRVDRDERRRRLAEAALVGQERLLGLLLALGVDRRVDLQPAVRHRVGAEALVQLVQHVVEQVRLAPGGVAGGRVHAQRLADRRGGLRER